MRRRPAHPLHLARYVWSTATDPPHDPRPPRVHGTPVSAEELAVFDKDDLARAHWTQKLLEKETARKQATKAAASAAVISLLAPAAAAEADEKTNAAFKAHDRHLAERSRLQLASFQDLSNYFHHGSKAAIGPNFQIQLNSKEECVATCDAMGSVCAGFMCACPLTDASCLT